MNTKVVYYTKSGNTQKIANAIGEALNCKVENMDSPLEQPVDILFLGASVYKFGIDKKVLNYIDNLNAKSVGAIAIFSTSAMSDSGYPKLVKRIKSRGIPVCEDHFYCKGEFMLVNKNRPNVDDVKAAENFAKRIVQK